MRLPDESVVCSGCGKIITATNDPAIEAKNCQHWCTAECHNTLCGCDTQYTKVGA